jgi:hypothetical protein
MNLLFACATQRHTVGVVKHNGILELPEALEIKFQQEQSLPLQRNIKSRGKTD